MRKKIIKYLKINMRSRLVPVNSVNLPVLSGSTNLSLGPSSPSSFSNPSIPNFEVRKNSAPEILMDIGNAKPEVPFVDPTANMLNPNITINSARSKVHDSPTTAVFENHEGVLENTDIEKSLLAAGFVPTEKILTRDENGNLICHFIKTRDHVGRASYVELDCDDQSGMGYIKISSDDTILTQSRDASIIPYSLTIGSFEANKGDIYGVGFECDNSICIMSRKDASLEPKQTVFHSTKNSGEDMGIIENHYVPFPIVKMTEILANPEAVHRGIATSHARMRNVAFSSCNKEVNNMKASIGQLEAEILRFDKISKQVTDMLSTTIAELEKMHNYFDSHGAKTPRDAENLKAIRFNLAKRNDLTLDYIALCHSMKERSAKIAVLRDEVKAFNDFSQTLFTGVDSVFVE